MEGLVTGIRWKVRELLTHKKNRKEATDYTASPLTAGEEIRCFLEGMLLLAAFAYFFYRSIYAFLLLTPFLLVYRRKKKRSLNKKRRERLEKEFREALLCVNVNLQAGYSLENAFLEAGKDVLNLMGDSADMVKELQYIRRGLYNKLPLEQLLWDLGQRCPGGEIEEFSEIFSIAKKTGGKWQEVMKKTIDLIQEKAEMKEEIETLIHARYTESRIMCVIPFLLLAYMDLTSPGYFQPLYHNPAGIGIMTVCLALYGFVVNLMEKMTQIEL